jgi:antitoxin component YwqK of YwqJK toxin-antitoxin module
VRYLILLVIYLGVAYPCFGETKGRGVIREYDLHNRLRAEYSYKDAKLDGYCKEYYENGRLASKRHYQDGKRDGSSRLWGEDGKLEMESFYKAGKYLSGREFNENGRALEGLVDDYYPDGKLFVEASYRNGQRDGITRVYYEDGTLRTESLYKEGRLINEKEYDVTGKLMNEEKYKEE